MAHNPRRFTTKPLRPSISFPPELVGRVDQLFRQGHHHQHRNFSEFVRQAVEHELQRCGIDTMPPPGPSL